METLGSLLIWITSIGVALYCLALIFMGQH